MQPLSAIIIMSRVHETVNYVLSQQPIQGPHGRVQSLSMLQLLCCACNCSVGSLIFDRPIATSFIAENFKEVYKDPSTDTK